MNLCNYLSNAHILCYAPRKAYWDDVDVDLEKLGVKASRYVMGDGSDTSLTYDHIDRHHGELPGRQRLNYTEAVTSLLRRELQKGSEYAAFFEDDCMLYGDSLRLWEELQAQLESLSFPFDFFYLHGVRIHSTYRQVTPNLFKMDGCLGFRAVILSRRAMGEVAKLRPSEHLGIDGMIKDFIHPRMEVYSTYPCLLRSDRDQWSYQHEREVKPEWLDMCVSEKGRPA